MRAIVKEEVLESGQPVHEISCPADPTIVVRKPRKVKQASKPVGKTVTIAMRSIIKKKTSKRKVSK